jgi:mRNA-degrading endonuclease RelE of RelBE toxin-antitoxin system
MNVETIIAPAARRDLRRLDRQVAQRVLREIREYAETGHGDIARLQGSEELRLRVGDWRVRLLDRIEARPAEPPATGTVDVRVVDVLRVRHRREAYRD